ncbi:MAG TPA: family 78 glycoside hydrolase catalytic domain [Microbacterium sp.]|nr:family 78 glycoside hydrolase catalytic domain [Microbacterium sp.]
MTARDIRVEHLDVAIGIGTATPRLSWRDDGHVAYEIEADFGNGDAARSGRIDATGSSYRPWPLRPLASRERADVRVRLWTGADDEPGAWSAPLQIEAGLLHEEDWAADWVSPSPAAPHDGPRPAYLLRAEFESVGTIRTARVYATAHGVYDLVLNGAPLGDEILSPGWSSYRHRIRYRTYDGTALAASGANVIGVWLADGWYRGRVGFNGGLWDVYGSDVAARVQVEIEDDLGRRVVPLRWSWAPSPIVATGLYEGETHDARQELTGWDAPGYDVTGWSPADVLAPESFGAVLEAPTGPPVRVIESLKPVKVVRRADGRILLDFGQNIAGRLRVSFRARPGAAVELHHAEVLEDGELSTRPLRSATSVDRYLPARAGAVDWSPRFAIHGFRYAEIRGLDTLDDLDAVVALVIHSDMTRSGWFDTDDPLLSRFHENVVWSMRDNFVDLPTDCPQRDERLGWSGDIQVFAPAAAYLYDCTGVLQNWLRDLAAEQREFGSVMNFHPWLECGFPSDPAAAWGDAAVIVPWELYRSTGDVEILRQQFDSMRAWVEQVHELTGGTGHWSTGFQLGDWLDPAAPPDRPGDSRTDPRLVATAYHARTARLTAQAAALVGDSEASIRLSEIAQRAEASFRRNYVSPAGLVVSDTVTALSIALVFGLLDGDGQRAAAGARLAELVQEGDHLIQTGFVGTPLVCDALASTGHLDTAYHLLLRQESPSWLYPVTMGATTVWERWDSLLTDGSVNPGEMTSFNHYALGAVVDFLHRVVGGLELVDPGWSRVRIAPRPGGGLGRASAAHLSPQGRIVVVDWSREDAVLTVDVEIPASVTAIIDLPGTPPFEVGAGTHRFTAPYRAATDDPPRPRRWNIHNPEERLQMIEAGVL